MNVSEYIQVSLRIGTMQFYLGPMSLNVIQTALDFSANEGVPITFIPSRRQVDIQGGYVCGPDGAGLTMKTLRDLCGRACQIERDHAGPGQGGSSDSGSSGSGSSGSSSSNDDGIASLLEDAKYADILHIDPWKAYPAYEEGLAQTIDLLQRAHAANPACQFEIGTEESIRRFEVEEVARLIADVRSAVSEDLFARIRFVVVQCGTALKESHNTGTFDEERLKAMLAVVAAAGKEAKEHNGDWVSEEVLARKRELGLQHVNIAPELGGIESSVVYDALCSVDKEAFFRICWASDKWCKWVSADFDPWAHKAELVRICGHYVFGNPVFQTMVERYPALHGVDGTIRTALYVRLKALFRV